MFLLKKGLANPDVKNEMEVGEDVVCSVMVEADLVEKITAFQGVQGIAKRTEAAKILIELGLSVHKNESQAPRSTDPDQI